MSGEAPVVTTEYSVIRGVFMAQKMMGSNRK